MLLYRESTPSEAAFSGTRSVPGEEGWVKGSTVVGRLPGTPMIRVSQDEVCVAHTTSTPGDVVSVSFYPSPHTRAERGFGRGQGGINSPGRVEKVPKIPYNPLIPHHPMSSQCTQDFENKESLAAKEISKAD